MARSAPISAADVLGSDAWQAVLNREPWSPLTALFLSGPKFAPTAREAARLLGYWSKRRQRKRGGARFRAHFYCVTRWRYGHFVREWRMLEARRLRKERPNDKVLTTARAVGFRSEKAFARAYCERWCETPHGVPTRCHRRVATAVQCVFEFR